MGIEIGPCSQAFMALCLKRETLIGLRLTQSDYGNYLYQIFMRNISILNIYNNFL